jgi:tetratricopeptide (TPR) repeat protein
MTFPVRLFRGVPLLMAGLLLSGCLPSGQSQFEEEKEAHFLAGKSRVNAMDYKGAIESFEKALEVNPRSAAAHFELGILFEKEETDSAAAIYHYGEYLKLRPRAENGEIVRQHVMSCKQELARTVSLGPVTEKQQRDLDKLAEENKRLTEENKRLNEEVAKWRAYFGTRSQGPTNAGSPTLAATRPVPVPDPEQTPSGVVTPSSPTNPGRQTGASAALRTHTIKAGETPTIIARQYGVKVEALMAANPKVEARRLRPGQTLNIPAP